MTLFICLCRLDEITVSRPCLCYLRNQESSLTNDDDSPSRIMSATTGIPITSVSLMVGDVPISSVENDAPQEMVAEPESSSTVEQSPSVEECQIEKKAVEELKLAIRKALDEEPESSTVGNASREDSAGLLEKMLADQPQLVRILIARKYRMEACVSLFFEQLRFRARWRPEGLQPEDIPNALPSGAWRLAGYTKEGIVVSNYKLRYWKPGELGSIKQESGSNESDGLDSAINEYTNYVIYMIEAMIANMKALPTPQKFVVLFDLKGFTASLVFRKDVRAMIRKLIYVAQAQYPERLHQTLLVNAPFGFESAWGLIKPLLDEKTAAKIHFVSVDSLTNEIDAEVLSKEYGGKHEEYSLPSA